MPCSLYHFYRLLQRAKNIYILYNTETDIKGKGEKSRFVTQMLLNRKQGIQEFILNPVIPQNFKIPVEIQKSPEVIEKLKAYVKKRNLSISFNQLHSQPISVLQTTCIGL